MKNSQNALPPSTNNRWTKEQDNILKKHVTNNPHNLAESFETAGKELGKGAHAVRSRYYSHIRPDPNSKLSITVTRNKKVSYNTKNVARKPITIIDDFNPVVDVMTDLAKKLSAREKAEFVKMLFADR